MKKPWFWALAVTLGIAMNACAAPSASPSQQVIEKAGVLPTVEQKVSFLVDEAKAFVKSQKFQEAINVAQYVLQNLDKDSEGAKSVLAEAKAKLGAAAQQAVGDVKKNLGGLLK